MTHPKLQTTADLAEQLRAILPPAPQFLDMLEELRRRAEVHIPTGSALESLDAARKALDALESSLEDQWRAIGPDTPEWERRGWDEADLKPGGTD